MPRPSITKSQPYTFTKGPFAGQTFTSERQYRNALAQAKGFQSWHTQQRQMKRISSKAYVALKPSEKQARGRALDALARMRTRGESLSQAARHANTTPNTILKWAGTEMQREPQGRWKAKTTDRLVRRMTAIGTNGVTEVEVRSSRQASLLGQHAAAVKRYLRTGDAEGLSKFKGKKIAGVELETDPDRLIDFEQGGEMEFEDIYKDSI